MSLVDDASGYQAQRLAVLYCDISHADAIESSESEIALWRVNSFRTAREMAVDYGGDEAPTSEGGWAATFPSTVEALLCAQALSSLVGWQAGGPSLSGGLSAGEVTRNPLGICGAPVREAISLCHRARPRQILVADPLHVVVAREAAASFAPAPRQERADFDPAGPPGPGHGHGPGLIGPGGSRSVFPPPPADGGGRLSRSARARYSDRYSERHPDGRPVGPDRPGAEPALRLVTSSEHHAAKTGASAGSTAVDAAPNSGPVTGGIRLTVLGWVQLETGDPPRCRSVMRGSQARAVLSRLALRRGPVHKDELAELLWPGTLPEHWEGALRGLVTKVRRFLDAGGLPAREVLVGEGGYYELRLPAGVTVDREVAITLVASARTALAQGRSDESVALARRAAAILEGRVLSGPDNAWFDQVRAELAHDRLAALELWARAALAAGSIEGAKRAVAEALALDPYRESSYRLLMRAHAAAGSVGEALRVYERCRRMLAEELGVGPSAQTQALYIQLLG